MGNMIFIAKKNGVAVVHADEQAMFDLDGVRPELTITLAEYMAAGSMARIINGEIIVGKTDEEKAEEEMQVKIENYMAELEELDKEAGAGRSVRDICITLAEKNDMSAEEAYKKLKNVEDRANTIRDKLHELDRSLDKTNPTA